MGMKRLICCIAVAAAVLSPYEAIALSPVPKFPIKEEFTFLFTNKSSSLSDANKVSVARHLPRINSIDLEIVIVSLWTSQQGLNVTAQNLSKLNIKRRESILEFLIDLGVPKNKIYFEAKPLNSPVSKYEPIGGRTDGLIQIWYGGMCKDGYESMCFDH